MQKEFKWGKLVNNQWFHEVVSNEIFVDRCYTRFFDVESGDVVLDVGASVGPFSWSILEKNPGKIVCLEPEPDFFETLQENLRDSGVDITFLKKGMAAVDGLTYLTGLFDENKRDMDNGVDGGQYISTVRFDTLVKKLNLSKIDFLKTDCEGQEYAMFNDANLPWIQSNVRKIAGEFHLNVPFRKDEFRKFRDTYLKTFANHKVLLMDYTDVTDQIWTEEFIQAHDTLMVYIDNRTFVEVKKKWQHYVAPTMEVTTIIPEKGCVVDCAFCPQRILERTYKGERRLTLDNFKLLIDKIPTDVRITFAGFTEPWLNSRATDMVLYAHEQGHPVSVFTTGVGMQIEDLERMIHIPFAGNPNGGFTFHLPDAEHLAKHPITPKYIQMIEWLKENHHRIQNFSTMSMGPVHPQISKYFNWAPTFDMWSRAGNLVREALLKPELINLKDRWNAIYHGPAPKTCKCDEHLYHNVLLPNGDVSLCCMDYGLEHILGNLYQQEYVDIIPEQESCFELCNYCENGRDPQGEQQIKFFPRGKLNK